MKLKINKHVFFFAFILAVGLQAKAQENNIVGRITTFKEYGLKKVTVSAKNAGTKTISNDQGYYKLKCQADDKITFQANGFYKQTVNLKKIVSDSVNVNLRLKNGDKNFKLATGYGYIDKDKLSYAIQHFESNKDFSSYNSVLDILQGRLTGVSIGTDAITIRGKNTFGGGPALLVVDGNIVDMSYLKNIPTSQVKSVDVLKGAAASARYGSRGMNGVIVIQTKSKN